MPTLPEQFLTELTTRLHAQVTALFPAQNGGALRGNSFPLEREQRPGIRVDDGVWQTPIATNQCAMECSGACSIIITATSEAERDVLVNAAYRALDHRASPWPMKIFKAAPTEVRYTRGGADQTAFVATIPIAVGPFPVHAYQLDAPS